MGGGNTGSGWRKHGKWVEETREVGGGNMGGGWRKRHPEYHICMCVGVGGGGGASPVTWRNAVDREHFSPG